MNLNNFSLCTFMISSFLFSGRHIVCLFLSLYQVGAEGSLKLKADILILHLAILSVYLSVVHFSG